MMSGQLGKWSISDKILQGFSPITFDLNQFLTYMIDWQVTMLSAPSASSASFIHCSRFISTAFAFKDATADMEAKSVHQFRFQLKHALPKIILVLNFLARKLFCCSQKPKKWAGIS